MSPYSVILKNFFSGIAHKESHEKIKQISIPKFVNPSSPCKILATFPFEHWAIWVKLKFEWKVFEIFHYISSDSFMRHFMAIFVAFGCQFLCGLVFLGNDLEMVIFVAFETFPFFFNQVDFQGLDQLCVWPIIFSML